MDAFNYRDGELFAEGVALTAIAERFGTPTYVYSRAHIEAQYNAFADALNGMPHLVCFAVKANSNLGVLNVLARLGAGFDIVSRGELERVLAAGGTADKIVFSGVGKTRDDMRRALEVGVHCFNVESTEELERLQVVAAEMGVRAPISLRVNPDVDAGTHPYISTGLKENKFGIAIADAEDVYIRAAQLPNLEVVGVDCHIGSQLTTLEPFIDALDRLLALSGIYTANYGFDGYWDEVVYQNSPVDYMANLPNDHYYIDLYNAERAIICVGQGAWEQPDTTLRLKELFAQKGIHTWVDAWGYDVNHDWPWWYKMVIHYIPWLLYER